MNSYQYQVNRHNIRPQSANAIVLSSSLSLSNSPRYPSYAQPLSYVPPSDEQKLQQREKQQQLGYPYPSKPIRPSNPHSLITHKRDIIK